MATYSDSGYTKGSGYVMRWSQSQPSNIESWRCGGLCVVISGGSQNITITPIAQYLTLDLVTTGQVAEGDSVEFRAKPSGGATSLSNLVWKWTVRSPSGDSSTTDLRTTPCGSTGGPDVRCKKPLFLSGRMTVSALIFGRRETATLLVDVQRLAANMACSPSPLLRGTQAACTVTVTPNRSRTSASKWKFVPTNVASNSPFANDTLEFVEKDSSTLVWKGFVVAAGQVFATAHLRGRDTVVTAAIGITPRSNWTSLLATVTLDSTPTGLDAKPDSIKDLGNSRPDLPMIYDNWHDGEIVDGGPNDGYWYFLKYPWRATHVNRINRIALDSVGVFASYQDVNKTGNYCTRAELRTLVLPWVVTHENTHVAIFDSVALDMTTKLAEKYVGRKRLELYNLIFAQAQHLAWFYPDSLWPTQGTNQMPCVLRNIKYPKFP